MELIFCYYKYIIKILVKMENSVWENILCQSLWNYINLIEKDFVNVCQKLWIRMLMYYYKVDHIYPIIVLMWIMYLDRLVYFVWHKISNVFLNLLIIIVFLCLQQHSFICFFFRIKYGLGPKYSNMYLQIVWV